VSRLICMQPFYSCLPSRILRFTASDLQTPMQCSISQHLQLYIRCRVPPHCICVKSFLSDQKVMDLMKTCSPLVLELLSLQTTVASALLQLLASTCTLSGALPYHLLLSGALPYHLLHPLRSITSRSALFPRIWTLSPADVKTQEFGMKKMPPPSSSRW